MGERTLIHRRRCSPVTKTQSGPKIECDRGDECRGLAVNHCEAAKQLWPLCTIAHVWINYWPTIPSTALSECVVRVSLLQAPAPRKNKLQEATVPEGKDIQSKQSPTPSPRYSFCAGCRSLAGKQLVIFQMSRSWGCLLHSIIEAKLDWIRHLLLLKCSLFFTHANYAWHSNAMFPFKDKR